MRSAANAGFLLVLTGISCIGFHVASERKSHQYGADTDLKICFITEPGIDEADTRELAAEWDEELSLYGIRVKVAGIQTMKRPGFMYGPVLGFLNSLMLEAPCDRIVYLMGRTAGDIAFEVAMMGIFVKLGLKFEVHGAVETRTHTRGFVKAQYMEFLQLLFSSPRSTMIHEGYHLLGCEHSFTLSACYARIARLKEALSTPGRDPDFFPTYGSNGVILTTRSEVNAGMGWQKSN